MNIKEGRIVDDGITLDTCEIELDGTTLSIISGYGAFAMCGALNVDVYNTLKMKSRKVICMRALGVKNVLDLFDAKIEECSNYAGVVGIESGMIVRDAFKILSSS